MLLNQDAVDAVLERNTAAFAESVQGRTIIGMGSVDPSYSVALASDIAQAGGTYLEAPVSGSRVSCVLDPRAPCFRSAGLNVTHASVLSRCEGTALRAPRLRPR